MAAFHGRARERDPMKRKLVLLLALAAVAATEPRTIWDGVYSSDQVARGKKAYAAECASCHGTALEGIDDSPALVGAVFHKKWDGKSVGRLIDVTRRTMPTDTPGTLSRQVCTDIVVYMLDANGFPTGKADLAPDAPDLRQLLIEPKK